MSLGGKLRSTVNSALVLACLAYAAGCTIKTTQLNRELSPLMNKFESIAKSGDYELNTGKGKLDYRGKLTEIINERDAYLKTCGKSCSLRGKWTVSIPEKGKPLITVNEASCYNPFANIPKYQGK